MKRNILGVLLSCLLWGMFAEPCFAYVKENQFYRVSSSMIEEKKNYYSSAPEIEIRNLHSNYVTKYCLEMGSGKEISGRIQGRNRTLVIPKSRFEEGENIIEVWADTGGGQRVEKSGIIKTIYIDSKKPKQSPTFSYGKYQDSWVRILAKDEGAGIEGIYYQIGNRNYQYQKGSDIKVTLPQNFRGVVSAYGVDRAGNKSAISKSREILVDQKPPVIQIHSDVDLKKWHKEKISLTILVNDEANMSGLKQVKCFLDGQCQTQKVFEKEGVSNSLLEITIDKKGTLKVLAEDFAGNQIYKEQEIRVDREPPKIELCGIGENGVSKENIKLKLQVQDESEVCLKNGKLIRSDLAGEVQKIPVEDWEEEIELREEGIYYIYVEGMDEAENETRCEYKIAIDRSPPDLTAFEEMQGSVQTQFQWDDDLESRIKDLNHVTLECWLNGRVCTKEKVYDQQGRYFLEIVARDPAGNKSVCKIRFVIKTKIPEVEEQKYIPVWIVVLGGSIIMGVFFVKRTKR